MEFELALFQHSFIQKQAVGEILKCNDFTVDYGLVLTEKQAAELVETRALALKDTGRIEFGGGVIDKIIHAFCDSPYISTHNYEETLHELVELFYSYKNETLDLISDDDLIRYMKTAFDGRCGGSLELLSGRELYRLARNLRFGYPENYDDSSADAEEEEDGEY